MEEVGGTPRTPITEHGSPVNEVVTDHRAVHRERLTEKSVIDAQARHPPWTTARRGESIPMGDLR
ncbi:hypothetical protein BWI15_27915 [Kribbella sp. ALI-6-A]|nr:hypothetical protein BWI15_27915 [Kribbella sp. ALI-6-A]